MVQLFYVAQLSGEDIVGTTTGASPRKVYKL